MSQQRTPGSILILGSGVFGLSTAWALTRRHACANVTITLVSPDLAASSPVPSRKQALLPTYADNIGSAKDLPALPDSTSLSPSEGSPTRSEDRTTPASIDTTRIIRADYADPLYASLAREAQQLWRTPEWGGSDLEGSGNVTGDGRGTRYHENGLLLTADAGGGGEGYMRKSLENVRRQQQQAPTFASNATSSSDSTSRPRSAQSTLLNEDQIRQAMRTKDPHAAGGTGNVGYVNAQSGWADAEACMRELEARVRSHGRVRMVKGKVTRLATSASSPSRVSGAVLKDGSTLEADLTILATGAWTPALLDLRGRASVTAQSMAYFDVSDSAAEKLNQIPVHLNIGTGCFLFPPNRRRARQGIRVAVGEKGSDEKGKDWEIKVARHAFGYINPVTIQAPLGVPEASDGTPDRGKAAEITVSLPAASSNPIPNSDISLLSSFLGHALPALGDVGKPSRTRLCHYLDTVSGEYIIDYHPGFDALFVATGGSGHAFKMLPVLGDKILDVLENGGSRGGISNNRGNRTSEETKAWAKKWAWPERQSDDQVWCNDGSRAGVKGLSLAEVRGKEEQAKL